MVRIPLLSISLGLLVALVSAQGRTDYLNFESPQVKPITVARIDGVDFLLVCNTPDNSVEVYDISTSTLRESPSFVTRIPVGLEPVSVVYHAFSAAEKNMMYTVNWLGDSVTYVQLSVTGGNFGYEVVQEVPVTDPRATHNGQNLRCDDEPMHLTVLEDLDGDDVIVVTKRTASSIAQFDALVDSSGLVGSCFANGANLIMTDTGRYPVGTAPSGSFAIKEPHTILRRPGTDEVWVLGHQGGGSKLDHDIGAKPSSVDEFPNFNLDLWGMDYDGSCTPSTTTFSLGFTDGSTAIGTTNFNMGFNSDGSALYVVGTDALNDILGNELLLEEDTGFVRTLLYRVKTSDLTLGIRDLDTTDGTTPVTFGKGLAHATDVVVHTQGTTDYVCVVGFNSDVFGVVDIPSSQVNSPNSWEIRHLPLTPLQDLDPADSSDLGLAGPRGLALLDPVADSTAADVRVYVLNRFDNSVVVIDPKLGSSNTPVKLDQFALQLDPVPDYIRHGQSFLYGTKYSDSGFVACASCHVDGRSDQLSWRLSSDPGPLPPTAPSGPGAPHSFEGSSSGVNPLNFTSTDYDELVADGFPSAEEDGVLDAEDPENPKGPMITQSLQGLVNFEVGGDLFDDDGDDDNPSTDEDNILDDLVTNAPYHWRGDKEGFRHFNEAFSSLQGMTDLTSPTADPHGGLTIDQMKNFEQFLNSIHYPPNPVQPATRAYQGSFGDPDDTDGTGALAGLKLFHTQALDGPDMLACAGRSCVQCHWLPEGSNNRITCAFHGSDNSVLPNGQALSLVAQPLETAALRGLMQKEGRLELRALVPPASPEIITGDRGMGHDGVDGHSRNEFLLGFSGTAVIRSKICGFLRQIDHGTAPIIGLAERVVGGQSPPSLTTLEDQAKVANCGLAVYARVGSGVGSYVEKGYWLEFDGNGTPVYKEHGSSTQLSSSALLSLLGTGDGLILVRAVPLGSERRIAAVTGSTKGVGELPYSGSYPAPSDVRIVGTTPDTAYAPLVAQPLYANWLIEDEDHETTPVTSNYFVWEGLDGTSNPVPEPLSLRITRAFQIALASEGVLNAHDAPRRLQFVGVDLYQGCSVRLTIPDLSPASSKTLVLPLYPTDELYEDGEETFRIWETAVEFDPLALYTLMLGGPADSDVRTVYQEQVTPEDEERDWPNAEELSAAAGSASGVSYALDAMNAGGTSWTAQSNAVFVYPEAP